jgi:hypothetical protein
MNEDNKTIVVLMVDRVRSTIGNSRYLNAIVTVANFAETRLGFDEWQLRRLSGTLNKEIGEAFAAQQSKGVRGNVAKKGGYQLRDLGFVAKSVENPSPALTILMLAEKVAQLSAYGLNLTECKLTLRDDIHDWFDRQIVEAKAKKQA